MFTIKGKKPMKLLSKGAHARVWALSTTLVAKEFELGDPLVTKEFNLLKEISQFSNLVPKPKERVVADDYSKELIIMERLYPLQPRALDTETRNCMFNQFTHELIEMHKRGFAHGDIQRNSNIGDTWDNVIVTLECIRLIDLGNAVTRDDSLFESTVKTDVEDLDFLRVWIFN
jgi:RIO-like serine/threonine protein kinase